MADFTKKLVDQAALEALAQGLNNKAKEAVAAEKTRAEAAEKEAKDAAAAAKTAADGAQTTADTAKATADQAAADLVTVKQDIADLTSAENGAVKQAKDYTDAEIKKVTDVLGKVSEQGDGDTVVPGEGVLGDIETIKADIAGLETVNEAEDKKITTLENLVGSAKVEGESPQAATGLFAEVDRLDAKIDNLEIPDITGLATETYVDGKITDLIGGADEAYNTLKKLQDELKGNDDAVTALTNQIAEKADADHNHDDVYAKIDHVHDNLAAADHKHVPADIAYTNDQYPEMATVADALDQLLYVTPAVKTFTSSPAFGDYEIGSTVSNPKFTWSYNKAIVNQNITGITLDDPSVREYQHTANITSSTTFTLSASDNKAKSATKNGSFNFKHKRYFGVAEVPAEYNSDFILGLTGKEFCTGRTKSAFSLTAGAGQYMFYCFPATYGTPTFNVGGFDGGFELAATIDFTNASGNTTSFVIWKSENANLGTQSIIVK